MWMDFALMSHFEINWQSQINMCVTLKQLYVPVKYFMEFLVIQGIDKYFYILQGCYKLEVWNTYIL